MTTTEARLQAARELLSAWSGEFQTPEAERVDVPLPVEDLLTAVKALDDWGYLAAITGLDLGVEAGQFDVLYHFCSGAAVVTLRVQTPREGASVPSVCGIIPSASVFERELSEMLGMTVEGTPDTSRLFLSDDWPDDVYPLRKDAALDAAATGEEV